MRFLSVGDELEFEALPKETRELCERVFSYYEQLREQIYGEGYNDGREEASEELEEAGYRRGYDDALEKHGIKE